MVFCKDLNLNSSISALSKLSIIGLISNQQFQKCRFLAERLHMSFPEKYSKPEIRGMLNANWEEYLIKMKRRHGASYYALDAPVLVYVNNIFLGDASALETFLSEKYNFNINLDFVKVVDQELIKYFENITTSLKRNFVYLIVSIDEHIIGSMLFMLYNDVVPITCENFSTRCKINGNKGYQYTPIHRIARPSWIQAGGWNLKHEHMPCENYAIPHNRRGVLSMCNVRPHHYNSTQFFITLDKTPWMDYKYVAFGQLVQGAEILTRIETVPTYYEKPLQKIRIEECGEFSLYLEPDSNYVKAVNPSCHDLLLKADNQDNIDSILNVQAYQAGKYCLKTDLQFYPHYLENFIKDLITSQNKSEEENEYENVDHITKTLF